MFFRRRSAEVILATKVEGHVWTAPSWQAKTFFTRAALVGALGGYVRPLTAELASRCEQIYGLFPKLRARKTQIAGTLSGGEQQMVAIGRALMSSPRLLILDEASLGLAPIIADQIFETVAVIRNAGVAVLLVEQNVHRSLEIADQVYVLDHGVVTFSGRRQQLRGEETLWRVYFGDSVADDSELPSIEHESSVE